MPDIAKYVVDQFAPDVTVEELDKDFDLIGNGIIDSLGLLRLISWLAETFGIAMDDIDIDPAQFQSINAIEQFVTQHSITVASR